MFSEARRAITSALSAAANCKDATSMRAAFDVVDKMPEWDLLSDSDQTALSTRFSGLIQRAADLDKVESKAQSAA